MHSLCSFGYVALAIVSFSGPARSGVILSEDFEDGSLGPQISVQSAGGFNVAPGIQDITTFGSTKAFGFGLSTCPLNCFFNHVSSLTITLPGPTFVSEISFGEMELFENWGSGGGIFIDGQPLTTETAPPNFSSHRDFGRFPYNDRIADTTFRTRVFPVNQTVTQITLRVADITNLSEIFIDELVVTNGAAPVPEPSTFILTMAAIAVVAGKIRHEHGFGDQGRRRRIPTGWAASTGPIYSTTKTRLGMLATSSSE